MLHYSTHTKALLLFLPSTQFKVLFSQLTIFPMNFFFFLSLQIFFVDCMIMNRQSDAATTAVAEAGTVKPAPSLDTLCDNHQISKALSASDVSPLQRQTLWQHQQQQQQVVPSLVQPLHPPPHWRRITLIFFFLHYLFALFAQWSFSNSSSVF